MKRGPSRAWPKGIVEVPATGPDSRADPQATQKISREQLEEALRRTKSGTRPVVRSEPNLDDQPYSGPRDDSPQVTIVRIDSMELETIDPSTLPAPSAQPLASGASVAPRATPSGAMPVIVTTPMEVAAALSRPPPSAQAQPAPPVIARRGGPTLRLHLTPRVAFFGAVAVALVIMLAAFVGFFAGRGVPGVK